MTEFMDAARLRQIASETGTPPSGVPVLRWTVDGTTGHAIARWELADKQAPSSAMHQVWGASL